MRIRKYLVYYHFVSKKSLSFQYLLVSSGNFIDITIKEKSREGGTGNKQKRSKGMVDTGGKENRRERKDEKRQQDPVVKMKVEGRRMSH